MFAKLVCLVAAVSAVLAAPEPQLGFGIGASILGYPSGVSPLACPNYPYCDGIARGLGPSGVVRATPFVGGVLPTTLATGLEYPAGVTPAECPNFPFCNELIPNPATRVAAVGAPLGALYGVNAGICPNYPYCL